MQFCQMKYIITLSALLLLTAFTLPQCDAWGFFGHRRINRMAVFTLPSDMVGFYKKNIEYITEHAVDPDKRRYASKYEAIRHYIDLDHWGSYPFPEVPRNWTDALAAYTDVYVVDTRGDTTRLFGKDHFTAVELFTEDDTPESVYRDFFVRNIKPQYYDEVWQVNCDALNELLVDDVDCQTAFAIDRFSEYGTCPYNLVTRYNALVQAFELKDYKRILRLSTEIGHYVGDAHVPLHTTENYNGQLSNQNGIHAFWETRLPELFADNTYDFFVGKAEYIDDPQTYFWDIILESHQLVDSVLIIEKELSQTYPEDQQFCFEERSNNTIRTQCSEYAKAYHERLSGMVEKRMCAAIKALGSVWLSAWVDAGQPDLERLDASVLDEKERKQYEELNKAVRQGDVKGREHG